MNDFLTTRELAELLRLKERKVYDLASSGTVPCSRATGKLLFPRKAIEAWIADHASGVDSSQARYRPKVMLGSHDPLLEWAIRESRCGMASFLDSSLDGLERFATGEGMATGLHVYNSELDDWNRTIIESNFSHQPVVLVSWATRQRGLIVNPDKQKRISRLSDLHGRKVAPRQAEAGSQVLFDDLLGKENINREEIDWLEPTRSEVDAALCVLEGKADTTFGLASIAKQYNLGFVPIVKERFDILVDRRAWFEPDWQKLLGFCHSTPFRQRAKELAGYNIEKIFTVRFNGG